MNKNIGIVIGIIVIAGIGYFAFSGDKMEKKEMSENDAVKEQMMGKDFDAVIAKAQSIALPDVSQSGASGTAWLAVYNGKTYHRVIAKNMPALPGTDFYEGWLVKNPVPGGFISSGRMEYNPSTKEARLDFVVDGDMSDYRFVVITSEPDDGDPAPDKHIIEARFPAGVNLLVSSDAMMDKKDDTMMNKDESTMTEKKDETMMEKEEVMMDEKEAEMMKTDEVMMAKAGLYMTYSADKLAMAETGDVVLFFHASWCPSCRALNGDIEKNANAIPSGVTILKTDYDKETELKKKYGVTTQHTLVQVDKDGNLIKKWSGGSKLENVLSQID